MISSVKSPRPLKAALLILSGAAALTALGAANAGEIDAPSKVVRYSPASLSTDQGAKVLYHRLERAAEAVCPNEPSSSFMVSAGVRECRQHALAAAVEEIHNPRLVAVSAARSKSG
jgi:UrcA family protein